MLKLTHTKIDSIELKRSLANPSAGALVTFEGWVRDVNKNRKVIRLEYEAAEELAQNEFKKIEQEVYQRYEILCLECVHRVGTLAVGDLAVWVSVISAHRKDSFSACEYIIDELKQRVPIWKKEHYLEWDSGWINHP
ncbi:MAG: molybdenum cofactor biosynthesis protein MoaE [Kiritimatiellae bacterium]|nr:molybdenum cofactor biosynthesis protein MoaE [Kiritimatiellia bacterium]